MSKVLCKVLSVYPSTCRVPKKRRPHPHTIEVLFVSSFGDNFVCFVSFMFSYVKQVPERKSLGGI